MKISENFDVREFVPKEIWDRFGKNSTWFVNRKCVTLAEFYKRFFTEYYRKKHNDPNIKVLIVINDYHYNPGSSKINRGYRTPDCKTGGELSQHKLSNAFDCDIIIVFGNGKTVEADYKEVHRVILENEREFMEAGLTTVEDLAFAPTWLHSDIRYTGLDKILIVKP